MQGLDETQVNEVFDMMYKMATRPSDAPPVAKVEPPKPTVDTDRVKKMMDPSDPMYDPAAAIGEVVRANVAPAMIDINTRAMVGVEQKLNEIYPDYSSLKPEIDKLFPGRQAGTISPQELESGYFVVKGAAAAAKEREARKKTAKVTTSEPTPRSDASTAPGALDEDQKRLAHKFYPQLSHADAEKKYSRFADGEPFEVAVPTGGKK